MVKINKKLVIKIILVSLILLIPFLLLLTNFKITLFNQNFYKKEFQKYGIYDKFPDAENINSDVLDYFKNNDEIIKNDFFNSKEKQHLSDVKKLIQSFSLLFYFLLLIFTLLLIILIYLIKDKIRLVKNISLVLNFGGILTFIEAFLFLLLAKLNFYRIFTIFHKIFFPQGNWLFNQDVDKIILLYPEGFFYDIAQKIVLDSLFWALILVLIGVLFLIIINNKIFKSTRK